MQRLTVALGLAVLAVALLGCGPAPEPAFAVVDGWPIGHVAECRPDDRCPEPLATAVAGLARRDPGHAAIVRTTLHQEAVLSTRSGACCTVARFELADGTVRAIGVGYLGISRDLKVIDRGP